MSFEPRSWWGVLYATLCDKVCQWLETGTPVSSTNKTDGHDIAEILLKVVLNTITLFKWSYAVAITWYSSLVNFLHFHFLLQNCSTNWNQIWQAWLSGRGHMYKIVKWSWSNMRRAVCEIEKWSILDNGSSKIYISMAPLRLAALGLG